MPGNFGNCPGGQGQAINSPCLSGRRAWIVSDAIAGHLTITQGIAESLCLDTEVKLAVPRWPWRQLAPNGPADPKIIRSLMAQRLPDIALGAGRKTVPIIRALKHAGVFTVIFQAPRTFRDSADLIWAPAHDRLTGDNVITTLTPPHRFTPARLAELRALMPPEIAALPRPRVTVLLGGPGAGYQYNDSVIEAFAEGLASLSDAAGCFLITPSRRTPRKLLDAALAATREEPRLVWDGIGDNPYPQFLAAADRLVVTADSVNMTGEACATGRPVLVFAPPHGRRKFRAFHQALRAYGATRHLGEDAAALADWSYAPIHAAEEVAAQIEARWRAARSRAVDARV
jgi:mitochondrial fission protein ELM1